MDNAKHFRNFSIIDNIFQTQQQNQEYEITLNYFTKYHGKSFCDSMCAFVKNVIKNEIKLYDYENTITDSMQVKKTIEQGILKISEFQSLIQTKKYKYNKYKILVLDNYSPPLNYDKSEILNFSLYLSFRFYKNISQAKIYHNSEEW